MDDEVQIPNCIQPQAAVPIDARSIVPSVSQLSQIDKAYVGLLIYVSDVNRFIKVTSVDDEDTVTGYEYFGEGSSFIIVVEKQGDNYVGEMSSQSIYTRFVDTKVIPVVKQGNTFYTPVYLSSEMCKFTNSQEEVVSTLQVQGTTWVYSETEKGSLFYCELQRDGRFFVSQISIEEIKNLNSKGIEVLLHCDGRLFTQIYTDGSHTVFGTLVLDDNSTTIGKVAALSTLTVGTTGKVWQQYYTPIGVSPIAGKDTLGNIQTKEDPSTDSSYMLPLLINSEGYAYNGLNIVEVQEPGLYVVDKNMDAGFSSELGTIVISSGESTPTTPTNPQTNTQLEEDVASLKSQVSTINTALGNLGNIKIIIDNNA